jgi:transposase InsO family protein
MEQGNMSGGARGLLKLSEIALRFRYMVTQHAIHRAKVLTFWETYGLAATKEAFGTSKPTLYRWRHELKAGKGKLESLNPGSRAPQGRRHRVVDAQVTNFLVSLRQRYPRLGKDKLKPLLDQYCLDENLKSLSASTVGRVLADLKRAGKLPAQGRVYLSGKTGRMLEHTTPKKRKKLRRKGYQPTNPGDLVELDTVSIFTNGVKRYVVTAIDLTSRFAFAYTYSTPSSRSATDFFKKFETVAPFTVKHVQTDNGSEFAKHFQEYTQTKEVPHFFNYPRCPKMHAHIERFNRTIQEEFTDYHRQALTEDIPSFNRQLMEWLVWYNTQRPHHAHGGVPPLASIFQKSHMSWTHTGY